MQLEEFAAKWGSKFPTIAQMWCRNWERVVPFFAHPPEVRRVIYTTNAIESTNISLRKILKTRGSFPTDDAALKLIYLALQNITRRLCPKSTHRPQDTEAVVSCLSKI